MTRPATTYGASAPNSERTDAWERAVAAMAEYLRLAGHSYPPEGYTMPDGRCLRFWAANLRRRHFHGMLSPEQIADLDALPGWEWRRRRPRTDMRPGRAWWQEGLSELAAWHQEQRRPPKPDAVSPSGYPVGVFAGKVRERHAAGRLPRRDVATLENLPGWTWGGWLATHRTSLHAALRTFVTTYGHLPQQIRGRQEESALHSWWKTQSARVERMDAEERALFEETRTFIARRVPDVPTRWYAGYRVLHDFVDIHGRYPTLAENVAAVRWRTNQRARQRAGELTALQVRLLDGLDRDAGR